MFEDYYKILNVSRDASQDEIKKAYYALARDSHPDLHPDDKSAKVTFQRIQRAFDQLSDPAAREKYNKRYDAHFRKTPPSSPGDSQPRTSTMAGPPPVAPSANARTHKQRAIEILRIVAGGFAGIVIGALILWIVFGLDPFGVMAERRNSKPPMKSELAQPPAVQSESPKPTDDKPKTDHAQQQQLSVGPSQPPLGQSPKPTDDKPKTDHAQQQQLSGGPSQPPAVQSESPKPTNDEPKTDHAQQPQLSSGIPPFAVFPFDATQASRHQQAWANYLGSPVEFTNSIGMKFQLVPPGAFMMGSPKTEDGRAPEHGEDLHRVVITKAFYLSTTEVTQQQYAAIVGANPSEYEGDNSANHPVEQVTWWSAFQFCWELSVKDGRFYQLPTEAEWEFACRAGTETPFYVGNKLSASSASFALGKTTSNVGSYPPSPFGLFDMMGNAWEWCYDGYDKDYYSRSRLIDPAGPLSGNQRVIRGGSFDEADRSCRSACRSWHGIHSSAKNVSFRVACQITPADVTVFTREPSKSPEAMMGFEVSNLDCGPGKHSADLNRVIDPSDSWVLSLEFRSKKIEDRIQCLFTWGDLRPGRDVINLTLSSKNRVSGWICDCRDNSAQYFSYDIKGDILKNWTRVSVVYDRVAGRLLMFCNGKLVYADRAMVRPVLDQPSPAWFGANGAGNDQRFTGEIRNTWISSVAGVVGRHL